MRASDTKLKELIKFKSDDKYDEQSKINLFKHDSFSQDKHINLTSYKIENHYFETT